GPMGTAGASPTWRPSLVRLKVDVILTAGGAVPAAKQATNGITGILWTEHGEHVPQGGGACRQNPARHEARRHSGRAGNQIRFVSQRPDRASTRPRRARYAARPRRRGDRMM